MEKRNENLAEGGSKKANNCCYIAEECKIRFEKIMSAMLSSYVLLVLSIIHSAIKKKCNCFDNKVFTITAFVVSNQR
jgi:hypothetical protein